MAGIIASITWFLDVVVKYIIFLIIIITAVISIFNPSVSEITKNIRKEWNKYAKKYNIDEPFAIGIGAAAAIFIVWIVFLIIYYILFGLHSLVA